MTIQVSKRVRKTFANKLASTATGSGRLLMLLVSDAVAVPATADGVLDYCNAVLNYSPNYGGRSGNRANVLAWGLVLPGSVTELAQVSVAVAMTSNRTITASNTGRIGSVLVISPHIYNSAPVTLASTSSVAGTMTSCSGFISSTGYASDNTHFGIPEANTGSYVNQAKNYYNGLHFITDSVGIQASSACVRTSTLDLVSGTPFTLYGFNLKANMAS